MKIIVPNLKPRAKWLNDILRAKRNLKHNSSKVMSRGDYKKDLNERLKE